MAAYSLDLRERIVEAVERQIGSKRKIAALFDVHESFIYKLLRQKRDRGDIAPLPHGGGAHAQLSGDQRRPVPPVGGAMPGATLGGLRTQLKNKTRGRGSPRNPWRGQPRRGLVRQKKSKPRP